MKSQVTKTSSCNQRLHPKPQMVTRCINPPSDGSQNQDNGPDRKKLQEVRRLNQERIRNLTGILTSVKTYFDTEMELRKSLFQEIIRISRVDIGQVSHEKGRKCKPKSTDQDSNIPEDNNENHV